MKSFTFLEVLFERIDRASVGIKVLKELFARNGQIGYLAHERLDAKLIRPEAVKVLTITYFHTVTSLCKIEKIKA